RPTIATCVPRAMSRSIESSTVWLAARTVTPCSLTLMPPSAFRLTRDGIASSDASGLLSGSRSRSVTTFSSACNVRLGPILEPAGAAGCRPCLPRRPQRPPVPAAGEPARDGDRRQHCARALRLDQHNTCARQHERDHAAYETANQLGVRVEVMNGVDPLRHVR